jgi:hypothetical protein
VTKRLAEAKGSAYFLPPKKDKPKYPNMALTPFGYRSKALLLAALFVLAALPLLAQTSPPLASGKFKGYAILGSGNVTAVYSDDPRVKGKNSSLGVQHFYFEDYTKDYIAASSLVLTSDGKAVSFDTASFEMNPYFCAVTKRRNATLDVQTQAFMTANECLVLSYAFTNRTTEKLTLSASLQLKIALDSLMQPAILTKKKTKQTKLDFKNGTTLLVASGDNAFVTLSNATLTLQKSEPLTIAKGQTKTLRFLIAADRASGKQAKRNLVVIDAPRLLPNTQQFWEAWMKKGLVPNFSDARLTAFYKQNLYAMKSANLNGNVPADITGQFVTNGMPQLYPRDAMMLARGFLITKHYDEAKKIIEFWMNPAIDKKSKGEWFARYDAFGKATTGGSGARFDEPEWDANGYFIWLASQYETATGRNVVPKEFIYELADFLVGKIDKSGLLYEGGIVEWSGYLPATNMTCAAALGLASDIAARNGDADKAKLYKQSYAVISNSLVKLFDKSRQTYTDVRFAGKKGKDNQSITGQYTLYLWDTSANFGVLYGYANHAEMTKANAFYLSNTQKRGGGIQYFDSPDAGLAGYGHDIFFFTTAAAAQTQALYGSPAEALKLIEWMMKNSNVYGLMPERIYLGDGNEASSTDCSPASPLSWCCAEFVNALVFAFQKEILK